MTSNDSKLELRIEAENGWSSIDKRAAGAFIATAIVAVVVGGSLKLANNSHADLVFVFLLYVAALPILLRWLRREKGTPTSSSFSIPDIRVPVIATFALLTCAVSFTYDHGHTIPDESAYQFQARIFAAGQLKADPLPGAQQNPAKTPREIYFEDQIDSARGWFAKYPPMWPLVLTLGYLAGCPWLVNPVLGVVLLLLVNYLARPWGRLTQNLAVLFVGCSGYTVIYSIGFMSHAFAAVLATGCLASLLYSVRTNRLGGVILCFLLVIVGTETRLYTGAVVALLCAGLTLWEFRRSPKLLWSSIVIISLAALGSGAIFFLINKVYTGNGLVSPYAYAHGLLKIEEMTINPIRIISNLATSWRWIATSTLCCTFPFVFVAVVYACWKENEFRRELICLARLFPLLMVAYTLQTFPSGSLDGERFYFEGYAAECVVAARGVVLLISNWKFNPRSAKLALVTLAGVQVVFIALVIRDVQMRLIPWRAEYRASIEPPAPPLVFLSGSNKIFLPKHANWNDVHWEKADTLYLNDPGIMRRDEVACHFNKRVYRVITFDDPAKGVTSRDYLTTCPAGT